MAIYCFSEEHAEKMPPVPDPQMFLTHISDLLCLSLTPLQPVVVRHGVVKPRPVHTLDGLMAIDDLEHLTDE